MIIAIAMTAKESDDKSQIRSMATDKQISDLSTPTYLYYHNHHHHHYHHFYHYYYNTNKCMSLCHCCIE